jgi:flagellin
MRIGTRAVGAELSVQHQLLKAFADLDSSSKRLSTMRRINRASDDPAGLVAAEQLLAELTEVKEAQYRAIRVAGAIDRGDSAMAQIGDLLTDVRGHVVEAAGGTLSDEQRRAKQIEIDAALEAIGRIGRLAPDIAGATGLELPDLTSAGLGNEAGRLADLASGGHYDLSSGNLVAATEILDGAVTQVNTARVQIAAFEKYTLDATRNVMERAEENLAWALSSIRDTDVALETSRLVRSEILAQASLMAVKSATQIRVNLLLQS